MVRLEEVTLQLTRAKEFCRVQEMEKADLLASYRAVCDERARLGMVCAGRTTTLFVPLPSSLLPLKWNTPLPSNPSHGNFSVRTPLPLRRCF